MQVGREQQDKADDQQRVAEVFREAEPLDQTALAHRPARPHPQCASSIASSVAESRPLVSHLEHAAAFDEDPQPAAAVAQGIPLDARAALHHLTANAFRPRQRARS
jgi:hypothetical protein